MRNEFDTEINNLQAEILALKQQKQTSANTLNTQSQTVTLTFNLELAGGAPMYVRSDKMAIIDIDAGNNNPLVGVNYNITGLDNRTIRDIPIYDENTGHIGHMMFIFSNNNDDLTTLLNGGTVTLTYNLTVSATTDVTISVNYEDLWVI